jgi:hypothetical protein
MPKRNFSLSLLVLCIGLAVPRTLRSQQTLGVSLPATLKASWSDSTLVDTIVTSYTATQSGSITLWEAQFYPALLNLDGSCPQPAGIQLKVLHPVGDGNYTVVSVGNAFDPLTLLETQLGITTCPVYGTPGFVQDNSTAVLEFTEPVPLQISAGDVIAFTVTSATSAGYALEWTSGSGFTVLTNNSAPLGATVSTSGGSSQSGYAPEILVEVASTMTLGEILPLPFPPAQVTAGIGTETFITPFVANQGGLITNWSAQFDPQMLSTDCEPVAVQLSVLRQTAPQTLTVESVGQVFDPLTAFQNMNLTIVNGCPSFQMYSPTSVLQFTESSPLQISGGDIIGVTFTPYSGGSYLPFAVTNSLTTRDVNGTVSVGQTINLSDPYTGTIAGQAPAIQVQVVPGLPIQPSNPASLSQEFIINPVPDKYIEFDFDYTTANNAGTLTVQPDTVPLVSASGITQDTYHKMVAGTSLATTDCYIASGEGTDSSNNPLCAAIALTCTNSGTNGSTPAGDNCPTSTARNLYWANVLETSTPIGGTSIPAGSALTLAMGSDTWSPGNCTLTGLETGFLCPQSMLTQFIEISTDTKVKGGGTGTTSNSTYILGCCEPEWSTTATVPAWTNSTNFYVSFTTSPPTPPAAPNNNWVAAPNQSITWGVEPLGATPDPTFPVSGEKTDTNPTRCPSEWTSASAAPVTYTNEPVAFTGGEGLYEVHYFSTACDNQEELVFTSSTDPTKNWAAFKTAPFNVDLTPPTVSTPVMSPGPVNGAYLPGQLGVTATVTCVDPVSNGVASGLVKCGKDSVSPSSTPPATSQASFTSSGNPVTIPSSPSALGLQTFTLTAKDQAGNQGTASVSYQVVGPLSSVSPPSINFGTVYLGTITVKSVTVTNVGNAPMTISTPFISILSGGNSREYVAVSLCPKSLAVEKSCTIYVNFVAGPFYTPQTAMLYVAGNAYGSPQTVALSATVINPQAWLSATSLSFGTVSAGNSATKTVTLKNPGATPLAITSITVAGANPGDFVEGNNCPLSQPWLAPGTSCTISVTFAPQAKGLRSASVVITDNALISRQKILLSGTGK